MSASLSLDERIGRAIELARTLQQRASELQTREEFCQQAELDRMLQNPRDKATLLQMTDQAFRSRSTRRMADQLTHILEVQGIPEFFTPLDRALLHGFRAVGEWLPAVSVPLVKHHMRQESAQVVLPAERDLLRGHLRTRFEQGVRVNLNFLGEALLGEAEATRRLASYRNALHLPELEVLSVKISTLYSQISPLAREHTLRILCDRLEVLYREAAGLQFTRADGVRVPKFVYLDMEEYRDMSLTAEAFMRTLDRPGLEGVSAGIALQAYLPDAHPVQKTISAWARKRVANGGAPVTIRLVKGANMEMERVEAAIRGWPQAPFEAKCDTDANYKRMLHYGMRPENLAAVRLGIASHNLFDLAYGLVLAAECSAGDRVQFEMLEGMANHQRRALLEQTRNLLLYAPACRREEFTTAIGYLIRRLDENTGPENFLRHAFRLRVDSPEWRQLEDDFRRCFSREIPDSPRRTQDRRLEAITPLARDTHRTEFRNEPDTDFALPQNGLWAQEIIDRWQHRRGPEAVEIPLVIEGKEVRTGELRECADPSRPGEIVARHYDATRADLDRALVCALQDEDGWRRMPSVERLQTLCRVADELRKSRGDLIGAAIANTGKTIMEADPEVSEAIDFAEYYPRAAENFFQLPRVTSEPLGVVAVVPPWNFPIAIPCGGIAAALAAGNTVILKPATPAVLVAWELCQCFWRAGVSRRVLQFVPCSDNQTASHLVSDPRVDAVILTGGTATAARILKAKPDLALFAETGGKNATIVTALSDREQAVKHVLHSAFSHAGQKCSATSLLLLEAEVYDDPRFHELLVDAASSLRVGSAWELDTRIGPLIRRPTGDLERALQTLEPGESWALAPKEDPANPHLWTPGLKMGVSPGSYTHQTEFFGPVLGVMRYERLEDAIEMVNSTGYGLTSGLESLDDREQEQWKAEIRCGNLYINKPTVGAIVQRQPFGGFAKSCFGPGLKAGGPNYVAQFMRFRLKERAISPEQESPSNAHPGSSAAPSAGALMAKLLAAIQDLTPGEQHELAATLADYEEAWRVEFSQEQDDCLILGEDNIRRYRALDEICIRMDPRDSIYDTVARIGAALISGASATASIAPDVAARIVECVSRIAALPDLSIRVVEEDDRTLVERLRAGKAGRLRYAARDRVPPAIRRAAAETGQWIAGPQVTGAGRVELLWYFQEQSISFAYHRYGNTASRSSDSSTLAQRAF